MATGTSFWIITSSDEDELDDDGIGVGSFGGGGVGVLGLSWVKTGRNLGKLVEKAG